MGVEMLPTLVHHELQCRVHQDSQQISVLRAALVTRSLVLAWILEGLDRLEQRFAVLLERHIGGITGHEQYARLVRPDDPIRRYGADVACYAHRGTGLDGKPA